METLALTVVASGAISRRMTSALPDSPVVVPRAPSRRRLAVARLLRRLADRLAGPPRPGVRPTPTGAISAPWPR
jgi:hypothetical protein